MARPPARRGAQPASTPSSVEFSQEKALRGVFRLRGVGGAAPAGVAGQVLLAERIPQTQAAPARRSTAAQARKRRGVPSDASAEQAPDFRERLKERFRHLQKKRMERRAATATNRGTPTGAAQSLPQAAAAVLAD